MGLIKQNGALVKGVQITPAYAKITRIFLQDNNEVIAFFGVSNNRENIDNGLLLDEIQLNCEIDRKEDKIFSNIYDIAKKELFQEWEDDIVE